MRPTFFFDETGFPDEILPKSAKDFLVRRSFLNLHAFLIRHGDKYDNNERAFLANLVDKTRYIFRTNGIEFDDYTCNDRVVDHRWTSSHKVHVLPCCRDLNPSSKDPSIV